MWYTGSIQSRCQKPIALVCEKSKKTNQIAGVRTTRLAWQEQGASSPSPVSTPYTNCSDSRAVGSKKSLRQTLLKLSTRLSVRILILPIKKYVIYSIGRSLRSYQYQNGRSTKNQIWVTKGCCAHWFFVPPQDIVFSLISSCAESVKACVTAAISDVNIHTQDIKQLQTSSKEEFSPTSGKYHSIKYVGALWLPQVLNQGLSCQCTSVGYIQLGTVS